MRFLFYFFFSFFVFNSYTLKAYEIFFDLTEDHTLTQHFKKTREGHYHFKFDATKNEPFLLISLKDARTDIEISFEDEEGTADLFKSSDKPEILSSDFVVRHDSPTVPKFLIQLHNSPLFLVIRSENPLDLSQFTAKSLSEFSAEVVHFSNPLKTPQRKKKHRKSSSHQALEEAVMRSRATERNRQANDNDDNDESEWDDVNPLSPPRPATLIQTPQTESKLPKIRRSSSGKKRHKQHANAVSVDDDGSPLDLRKRLGSRRKSLFGGAVSPTSDKSHHDADLGFASPPHAASSSSKALPKTPSPQKEHVRRKHKKRSSSSKQNQKQEFEDRRNFIQNHLIFRGPQPGLGLYSGRKPVAIARPSFHRPKVRSPLREVQPAFHEGGGDVESFESRKAFLAANLMFRGPALAAPLNLPDRKVHRHASRRNSPFKPSPHKSPSDDLSPKSRFRKARSSIGQGLHMRLPNQAAQPVAQKAGAAVPRRRSPLAPREQNASPDQRPQDFASLKAKMEKELKFRQDGQKGSSHKKHKHKRRSPQKAENAQVERRLNFDALPPPLPLPPKPVAEALLEAEHTSFDEWWNLVGGLSSEQVTFEAYDHLCLTFTNNPGPQGLCYQLDTDASQSVINLEAIVEKSEIAFQIALFEGDQELCRATPEGNVLKLTFDLDPLCDVDKTYRLFIYKDGYAGEGRVELRDIKLWSY